MKAVARLLPGQFQPLPVPPGAVPGVPGYENFAQSFANTIPWSENLGFVSKYEDPTKIDMVTYVGAHEIAHQWWAHQVIGADQQGGAACWPRPSPSTRP
jgi:hypothetical protein